MTPAESLGQIFGYLIFYAVLFGILRSVVRSLMSRRRAEQPALDATGEAPATVAAGRDEI